MLTSKANSGVAAVSAAYSELFNDKAASKPNTYEVGPKPQICPWHTGAMSELCRNSSRAWMLER
jgi:hypothetical protein